MKRCKACTTRAAGAVECTLLDGHVGAHEGEHIENGERVRALWNDPNAPYLEVEYIATPAPIALPIAELVVVPPAKTAQTHCPCGTEHDQKLDPSLRTEFGLPLVPWNEVDATRETRFAWPRVCRDCGIVYCQIWPTTPLG